MLLHINDMQIVSNVYICYINTHVFAAWLTIYNKKNVPSKSTEASPDQNPPDQSKALLRTLPHGN